jgi:hypothetical protein
MSYIERLRELPTLVEVYAQAYQLLDVAAHRAIPGQGSATDASNEYDKIAIAVEIRCSELADQVAAVAEDRARRQRDREREVTTEGALGTPREDVPLRPAPSTQDAVTEK